MTLLVSWIGIDSRKISSLYIASDSRISWKEFGSYDHGQKVFACKKHPIIAGYCGDAFFPSTVIRQIFDQIDSGLLFKESDSNETKYKVFCDKFKNLFSKYPYQTVVSEESIEVVFGIRSSNIDFLCKCFKWTKKSDSWETIPVAFNTHSDKLYICGTGRHEFKSKYEKFQESNEAKTSRAIFQCLCETLENMTDKYCGGSPQLVGLYNKFNAQEFGIIHENKRYLHGVEINDAENYNKIAWRNKLFEICDGETKELKKGAQDQRRL